jgi:hypothetical protein
MEYPVPEIERAETVVVAVPEFDSVTFNVVLLPTAIDPKLNEDGLTLNPGEVVSGLVLFDPVKPMQPAWKSPNTRHAAKALNTLSLLRPAEILVHASGDTVATCLSFMRPSSTRQRSNHRRGAATDRENRFGAVLSLARRRTA